MNTVFVKLFGQSLNTNKSECLIKSDFLIFFKGLNFTKIDLPTFNTFKAPADTMLSALSVKTMKNQL